MAWRLWALRMQPVGLLGVLSTMALVRGLTASASISGLTWKLFVLVSTMMGVAPFRLVTEA